MLLKLIENLFLYLKFHQVDELHILYQPDRAIDQYFDILYGPKRKVTLEPFSPYSYQKPAVANAKKHFSKGKNGILIIHRHKKDNVDISDKLKILDERTYGISKIIIGN